MSDHYNHEWRRARKQHTCYLCWRTILTGENYMRGSGMDNATAWTWKECAHCHAIIDIACDGELEYGDITILDWEPTTLAHLRLKALWSRKWTRIDGTLQPVPDTQATA